MSIDGIVLVDKPQGPTSHDVVARARRIFNTRKVGHAGTLDPMATGLLVLGIGRGTRLLGYLAANDKEYVATMRLGIATDTDDAQGTLIAQVDASNITDTQILEVVRDYRGHISQRPSSISAIKIDGKRAYARVRDGEQIELPLRDVTVQDLEITRIAHVPELNVVDVEVRVVCSAGTYIRALARDIGEQLGVGGHLTVLRRTRSGLFSQMVELEQLEKSPEFVPLSQAVRQAFPSVDVPEVDEVRARHGMRVPSPLEAGSGLNGVFASNGEVIALSENINNELVPVVVFVHGQQ
jgi:tRNA pseudouridine55 synthase